MVNIICIVVFESSSILLCSSLVMIVHVSSRKEFFQTSSEHIFADKQLQGQPLAMIVCQVPVSSYCLIRSDINN